MKFVYHYPVLGGTGRSMLDSGSITDVAARAERAGFDGFALTDHPIPGARWLDAGGHQSLDPFVALGAVGAVTSRVRLLTHLVVAPYRNPFVLAKAAATADLMSGGRMTLGLGAGYQKSEFFALGVDIEERNALFDEVLDVLPLHWSGEPFSYRGRHFDARNVVALPRPVQNPIPVWIGGNSTAARRRAAERAQGWMPMLGSVQLSTTASTRNIGGLAQLAAMTAETQQWAADARRGPIEILTSYHGTGIDSPSLDADRHREQFALMEEAGVGWLIISSPTATASATADFIDGFGQTYL